VVILTGDQEEEFDAQRLRAVGAEVRQLNTGSSCHLDASMIERELGGFVRPVPQLLIIENVGNLVCPAAFDLGETMKVALLSSTEGRISRRSIRFFFVRPGGRLDEDGSRAAPRLGCSAL
jgi:hydrogenase nickel incorporation protein HypB